MPVQIGRPPDHSFDEPLALLSDCHRRIERFLNVLVMLARTAAGGELDDDQRRSLAAALLYFREAAPKHTADEEESLFPRLRAAGGAQAEEILAEVDRLESDHAHADRLHREVDELGQQWLSAGTLSAEPARRFAALTGELSSIYKSHIETEDTRLFPLARRVLDPAIQRLIGSEMAARRVAR
jgi:hemerythrin-like domain-containing protein